MPTLPPGAWDPSYARDAAGPAGATGGGTGSQPVLILVALSLVLGAVVGAVSLSLAGPDPEPGRAAAAPGQAGGPPGLIAPLPYPLPDPPPNGAPEPATPFTGTATLANPTIATAKAAPSAPDDWCALLTPADIRAATGFAQQGRPDSRLLCTHHLADSTGYVFVSDIPAARGAPYTVRGNTAIMYQSDATSCEVSVVLNRSGAVLDIDLRAVLAPRVPVCQAAADLAVRAFDRLPDT